MYCIGTAITTVVQRTVVSSFEVIYEIIIYFVNMTRVSLFIIKFLIYFPPIKSMSFLQIFQKLLIKLIIIYLPIS